MKRIALALLGFTFLSALISTSAHANTPLPAIALTGAEMQTTGGTPSVTLTWGPLPIAGSQLHAWRAPCSVAIAAGICPTASEGTFVQLATIPLAATSYTDSTVTGNANYSYKVTAFCPTSTSCAQPYNVGIDGPDSNHVGAGIPGLPVLPPTLSISSITRNLQNGVTVLDAVWQDKPGVRTNYTLTKDGFVVLSNSQQNALGVYSIEYKGKVGADSVLKFTVCDATKTCQTKSL